MPKKIPFEERPEYVLPGDHIHPLVARAILSEVRVNSLSPEGRLPDASVRAIRNIAHAEDWVTGARCIPSGLALRPAKDPQTCCKR